jgi:long-chain acyl-CoA synthetase
MANNERIWWRSYPPEVPKHLDVPDVTLTQLLLSAAEEFPDREAVYFMGKRITYRRLLSDVSRFARALQSLGVRKGDRVAIMLPNSPQAVIAYYGALMIGAVVVQTNPMYMERELEHQLRDAGAETIICLDLLYPKVARVKERTRLSRIIVTGIDDYLPWPKNWLYPLKLWKDGKRVTVPYHEQGVFRFSLLLKKALAKPVKNVNVDADDLALLQYTGGTTGLPKGAMLTHHNLVFNAMQCAHWTHDCRRGEEKVLGILPFFHVYGMTVVMNFSVLMAATMILVPRFDVDEALRLISEEKPTVFPGAPTMYIALINHPDISRYDLSSIRACISGSAPLPVEVQQQFEELTGGRLVEGYGLTEASPVTHANPIWGRRKAGSIGLPWPNTDCRIVDPNTGEVLPSGSVGELQVKGPQVMKGYWNRPEETAQVLKDGWLSTGDIATMDEDGYFYILDRKKDMIIASGYNIYPREIEEVLYEHPAVKEAAVIGVPDPYRGETVKAFVVLKEGHQVTEKELEQLCRAKLARYKIPRQYEFRSELPKSAVGKVLRRVLVEEEKKKAALTPERTKTGNG